MCKKWEIIVNIYVLQYDFIYFREKCVAPLMKIWKILKRILIKQILVRIYFTLIFMTNKKMIRGACSEFGYNCRRYLFFTNNETRVSRFLWMGLFSEAQAILCLKWAILDKNGVIDF